MGRDGRTNPRAAAREAREEHERVMLYHKAILNCLNDYYPPNIYNLDWVYDDINAISKAIGNIYQEKVKADQHRRKKERYETRRNGVLRVRSWPVGCYLRKRWYKDFDGTDPFKPPNKNKHLSLGGGKLSLGGGGGKPKPMPRKQRYRY
jgi:hypothetical protein